ncbi:hypothetical protein [Streptomyces sp. GSL17-111]|uniref:hypothetical protein n=1 Tax=Streptomyces sp. GSL17-111 TaxID=3121596 RepID=UPI0030F44251
MPAAQRAAYQRAIEALAAAPYGHGSTAASGGDRDRRQVAIAGTVTVYLVSSGVLVVTVVRIVH